jgi:hypothetical protein
MRRHFWGEPTVYVGLPREEILVTQIEGYPVLIGAPSPNPSTQLFHVIKRLPTDDRPGIMISGFCAATVEETVELARATIHNSPETPTYPTQTR